MLPPLTIGNVKNPSMFILSLKEKKKKRNHFFKKKKEEKKKKQRKKRQTEKKQKQKKQRQKKKKKTRQKKGKKQNPNKKTKKREKTKTKKQKTEKKKRKKQEKKTHRKTKCLPCFCSVSCAQGMTFCSTLKGCGSHNIKCVHSVKLKAMCNVQAWRVDGQAQTLLLTRVAKSTSTCQHNAL